MHLSSSLARVKRSLATRGFFGTIRAALHHIRIKFLTLRLPTHPFDLRHNVGTSGYTKGRNLHSGSLHESTSTAYWSTAPSVLKTLLEDWQQTLSTSPQVYTFIDVGCGKGRALMVASDTPFQKIIGVELNSHLTETAQRNLATWQTTPHACTDITVLNADALTFPIPGSPLLFYLYHPFDAAADIFASRSDLCNLYRLHPPQQR